MTYPDLVEPLSERFRVKRDECGDRFIPTRFHCGYRWQLYTHGRNLWGLYISHMTKPDLTIRTLMAKVPGLAVSSRGDTEAILTCPAISQEALFRAVKPVAQRHLSPTARRKAISNLPQNQKQLPLRDAQPPSGALKRRKPRPR